MKSASFAATLLLGLALASAAHAATVDSTIDVSFIGLPIGTLQGKVVANGERYSYSGTVRSTALVNVVTKTTAEFSSTGRVAGRKVVPDKHVLTYSQRKKRGEVVLAFASGAITTNRSVPEVTYKEGTVPVTKAHLQGVLDPVAALVFPVAPGEAGDGKAVCNRTLPVFDGKTRSELKLTYAGTRQEETEGFSGPVHDCKVRFTAVSGHRPWKDEVKFWNANRDITVTMARVGDSNVYGLFGFDLKTQQGRAKGRASRFVSR